MKFSAVLNMVFGISAMTQACLANERPVNILFVMADDLGVRDLGCYGSDYYRTPNLDKLAAQGMRFARAYAACNVCSPTRAAILTGRYPHRVKLTDALPWDRLADNPKMIPPNHLKELPTKFPMFGKSLQEAGYRTALFGKWHLGNEEKFFTEGGHKAYGFDEAADCSWQEKKRDKGVDELTDMTIRFLRENKDEPFMVCLMHHVPHVPMACPPDAEALYNDVPKGRFQKNQKYAGMISHMDQSIEKLLGSLDELGLSENTVVVFSSDNGGLKNLTSNAPFRGGKGDLHEGGICVPLIVRWPGRVAAGSVCDSAVISMDYFPTFLELTGQPLMPEAHVDGQSMVPLLEGKSVEPRTLAWHFPHRDHPASAIAMGDWKLIRHLLSGEVELFDLSSDPEESNDLSSAHPERTERLAKMLEAHLRDTNAQRMRPNLEWDASRPPGKYKNYGIFYPEGGRIYQQVKEPYPAWFNSAGE
ncbi:sulfatase [Tichowtungia aerotolerans]|uniref:Sulfatase-like hydrolase/transferase n=1 Tax=Tichowtungia aerotolerans TaxID=2697043 RepID=A0A6P1MA94_9BACT|nr:sulfatase [Tichowtungia aerotolerans]QHI68496.1 sulfatase-like hydrolase/transferase [Tichowtungia aerotolerans]